MENVLSRIATINGAVNNFVWGIPAIICILGVGLLLTIRTRFLQIRKLPLSFQEVLGKLFVPSKTEHGAISPFQALCTALSATIGTGNIAGIAGAIALGGPGTVFWMWVSAFLGMCTKFAEVTLAVHFRERNAHGDYTGGPMYYIKNGLNKRWHFLATLYALFGVLTVFGTGNATQVNTITTSINAALESFNLMPENGAWIIGLAIGVLIAVIVAMVLLGGIKRIAQVTERLVPFMAVTYIILSLGVVIINIKEVPNVFVSIFQGAFNPSAVTGGIIGSFFISMRRGVSRGIFSNEAGLGTGSIAHASTESKDPIQQGVFGIFEVFVDTIIVCTLTALVILCSGTVINYGVDAGAALTISGFTVTYGSWVTILTAISMCCFAFSTILGWGLYGARCMEFLGSEKYIKPFMVVYSLTAILGATMKLDLIWGIADTFNGLMAIPNLIALFLLSGTLMKLLREKKYL